MTGERAEGEGHALVVIGVSAAGKSTVAAAVADRLGLRWVDADHLHPPSNVAAMASGAPLTDADRRPWLAAVGDALARGRGAGGIVVACSALKRVYRDQLRAACPGIVFIHLDGARQVLAARAANRRGHFMPAALLDSQLATLEPLEADEAGVTIDIAAPVDEIGDTAVAWVNAAWATRSPA